MRKLQNKLQLVCLSGVLALMLSACGYDGSYRYKCQDPEYWGATECVPPVCKATGTCTSDLVGFDPLEKKPNTIDNETTVGGDK